MVTSNEFVDSITNKHSKRLKQNSFRTSLSADSVHSPLWRGSLSLTFDPSSLSISLPLCLPSSCLRCCWTRALLLLSARARPRSHTPASSPEPAESHSSCSCAEQDADFSNVCYVFSKKERLYFFFADIVAFRSSFKGEPVCFCFTIKG